MRALDKDALVCDFAQHYNIFDLDRLDIVKLSILANGLPKESRIFKKMSGQRADLDSVILAGIYDSLNLILYSFAGKKGTKAPESLANKLLGIETVKEEKRAYASGEEFEKRRKEMIEKIGGNDG